MTIIKVTFPEEQCAFDIIHRMINVACRVVDKNQNTHFVFNNFVQKIVQYGNYFTAGKVTGDI
jgi:hypothetical protein